jgi:oligoendopeptidase F
MTATERHPVPPRRHLPAGWEPTDWSAIEPHAVELAERPVGSVAELERWLMDRSELDSVVGGESSRRHAAAACDTEDEAKERAHLDYQTVVLPEYRKLADRLDRKYLECPHRSELDPEVWTVYQRDAELAVELFREENVALEAEDEKLGVEYGRITGGLTVEFDGGPRTLAAMAPYHEDPDRTVREAAWRAVAARRLQVRDRLEELFDGMVELRGRIAANAGFGDYRDFKHRELGRFDYTPDDCEALHRNVERHVLPFVRRTTAHRARLLGLDPLRPWDFAVDPEQRPPFRPFEDSPGQVRVAAGLLERVDPEFAADLRWMEERGLLDLDTRPGKRQGGFMDTFEDVRWPFIFSNSAPTHAGIETLVHEGGHAVHGLLAREREPVDYRSAPIEFCEVASMGMEMMALEHLGAVYPAEEAQRAVRDSLEDIGSSLAWICTVDAFQHWVYTHAGHSRDERAEAWVALRERFGAPADWSGLEAERRHAWHAQLHVFEVPFYYVEYALAQIGALQVWSAYRRDPASAVARFREGLSLGGSQPLPRLFEAAGLRFDPRGESLGELMAEVEAAWAPLAGEGAPA